MTADPERPDGGTEGGAAACPDPLSGDYPRYALEGPRGLQVLLDATNRCNLRCIMCHFAYDSARNEPLQQWSPEFLTRVEEQVFPRAGHVQVSVGSEPLMWHGFPAMLDALGRARVPFVDVITNGLLLTEELALQMVRNRVARVQVSVESVTRESYESIRVGGCFDRLLANVRTLAAAKRDAGSRLPRLQFNIVLMRRNEHEIEDLLRLAQRLGVEDLDLRHIIVHDDLGIEDESFLHAKERFNRMMDRIRDLAASLGLRIVIAPDNFRLEEDASPDVMVPAQAEPEPHVADAPSAVCWAPWRQVNIRPDGHVWPCPFWYTRESMGDLHAETFQEIWDGATYRELRRELMTGHLNTNCGDCPIRGIGCVDNENAHYAHNIEKVRRHDDALRRREDHMAR